METTYEVDEYNDASTEAQRARGRLELQEAKLRYTHRRNEKFGGRAPQSPGAFSMSSPEPAASPFKGSMRSGLKDTLGSPDRDGIRGFIAQSTNGASMSPSSPMTHPGTRARETRPHVRTYLFEHQLENSMYVLEDGWKEDLAATKPRVLGAGDEQARRGTSASGASSTDRDLSRSDSRIGTSASHASCTSAAKPKYLQIQEQQQLEAEERARFNQQMGVTEPEPPPKEYSFEYYRNTATTPYIPIERLQGL